MATEGAATAADVGVDAGAAERARTDASAGNAPALPIETVLPDLLGALGHAPSVVLVAPPGAGKTTRAPLALLRAAWRGDGRIVVLEPRRLAARAAARRMAETLGEEAGGTVGYRVRLDSRVSARTRIEVVTEGVFTRMILDDPGLDGVAAVLFDEFHERSLEGDLGLALALDAQAALRPDLRLLVMSATLDGARVASLLGEVPVIVAEGRAHPVETRYLLRDPSKRIEEEVARAVLGALASETGSVLAFIPGQGKIARTAELLGPRLPADVDLAPLYGALDARDQDRAIRPASPGRRKVVLATAIAETSLTIEGVRIVVDSGLSRVPRYEPATGLTRLETVRVSQASADQRRGRAGRTGPGVCLRLWSEPETRSLAAFDRPEILEADLAPLALDLAAWGARDPADLRWLDPPPAAAWAHAVALLRDLGALDAEGRVTDAGRALARLPLHPRLSHMILQAGESLSHLAGEIAVCLTERGLGGGDTDLRERLRRFRADRAPRATEARRQARRFAAAAGMRDRAGDGGDVEAAGRVLLGAYPDRVAQARGGPGSFRLASGRGAALDPADPLSRAPFLVVAELQGQAAQSRILLAAPVSAAEIEDALGERIAEEADVATDPGGAVRARRIRRFGRLVLGSTPVPDPDPALVAQALLGAVRAQGLGALPWDEAGRQLRARIAFLRAQEGEAWPDWSDERLLAAAEDWLAPVLFGKTSLREIAADDLRRALLASLDFDARRRLDFLAPSHFAVPTGSRLAIDYTPEAGPTLSVRVQELFGLDRHPVILDGRVALVLELLSPAGRPIQVTRDLPGFWRGSWAEVRREMRGRYPKHVWPEDPLSAAPTRRAKPRGS